MGVFVNFRQIPLDTNLYTDSDNNSYKRSPRVMWDVLVTDGPRDTDGYKCSADSDRVVVGNCLFDPSRPSFLFSTNTDYDN